MPESPPPGIDPEIFSLDIRNPRTTKAELIEALEAERYRNGHVHIEYSKMDAYSKNIEEKFIQLELDLKDAQTTCRLEREHSAKLSATITRMYAERETLEDAILTMSRHWTSILWPRRIRELLTKVGILL